MNKLSLKYLFFYFFIFITLVFVCCSTLMANNVVFAEDNIKSYFLIKQNTLMIPQGQNIRGNIQLNATYYVQATGNPDVVINDVTYRYVAYNGITGLVPSSDLSKKSINNISNPFFVSSSKLTASSTNEDELLMIFNLNDSETNCRKIKNNDKLDFIAYSENGSYILAKLSDATIGYIPKRHCSPTIIYTPHPNPVNPDAENSNTNLTPDNPEKTPASVNKATITRVILIITLCVVVVVVIFLLFKPTSSKRRAAKDDFYDY